MARSHARVDVRIWRDDDWATLSPPAKLLYLTILSQPRLTLVGVIDLALTRWATLTGLDRDAAADALDDLEAARFVIVDRSTDELLVRTFVKNDLDPNRVNNNLARGLWGAWGCVASAMLRSAVVHEMPDPVWAKLEPHAPEDALQTRRSARLEPETHSRFQPETHSRLEPVSDSRSQPPVSSLLSPSTSRPPGSAPEIEPALTDTQRNRRLDAAAAIIGGRAANRPGTRDPAATARAVARAVIRDRHHDAYAHLAADPTLSPDALAELLEPTEPPTPPRPEPPTSSAHIPRARDVLEAQPPRAPTDELLGGVRGIRSAMFTPPDGDAA